MTSSRLVDGVRRTLLLVVLVVVTLVLWRNWDEVAPYLGSISASAWWAAIVTALLSPVLTLFGWRRLLAHLGTPLSFGGAAAIFLVGQLGKYVPGSVWSVVVQTEMAARAGVPRRRIGVVGLITIVVALLSGLILGIPAVPALIDLGERASLIALGVAGAGVLVVLYPPLLNRAINRGLRLLRRQPLEHALSGRAILEMAVWFTLSWLCTGLSVLVFAYDIAPSEARFGRLAVICVCGFALASTIGMLSIVLPAGVGAREAVLLVALAGALTAPAAAAVVVLTRFLTVIADVAWGLVGWLCARRTVASSTRNGARMSEEAR